MSNRQSLKIILVTSRVTYVPENYLKLFESFFSGTSASIVGVVFLDNFDGSLLKSILGLRYLGAKRIQKAVLKNIWSLTNDPRKKLCEQSKIPHISLKSMNSPAAIAWCQTKNPDLVINARTRCIYGSEILALPRLGCINIHHGLLPKYRGTMCDLYALSESRPAGFTIHGMNSKIDDGPIYKTQTVCQKGAQNYLDYLAKGALIEGQTLAQFVNQCQEQQNLPSGLENRDPSPLYTKNPTRQKVKELTQRGMVL